MPVLHIKETGQSHVSRSDRMKHGGVYRQHVGQKPTNNEPLDRSTRNFQYLPKVQHKVESIQLCLCYASEKFLGFMVSQRGIEVNPNKVRAIIEMSPLMNVKEVQHMSRRIAAFNRFVSRSTDKCFPFFKLLKKFEWTNECTKAFESLK